MGTFMYVLFTVEILQVGYYAYTYVAGFFYHCSFCCNGVSYDPEGGMSKVRLPAFRFSITILSAIRADGLEVSDK